ncbi:hypothetical protein D9613_009600 [Agrocybe pediades]|uniref:Uncharacterized protein n=1 Tax=Agrocybe pediades TaxID=84607 RepID=A0A8H4VTR9_9AGAR|nr:hypothetical protein D9613_009600 [Agrocybe pediades]
MSRAKGKNKANSETSESSSSDGGMGTLQTTAVDLEQSFSPIQDPPQTPYMVIPAPLEPSAISSVQSQLHYQNFTLFKYFVSSTSITLAVSNHEDTKHLWSQVVPTLSQAHPFLFHSILAVTTAHVAKRFKGVDSAKERLLEHLKGIHFAEALKLLALQLEEGVHEINCHSTFVGNCMCVMYLLSQRPEASSRRTLDISWALHLRRTCLALPGILPLVREGPIGLLIQQHPPIPPCGRSPSRNIQSMFQKLHSLCIDFDILGPDASEEMNDVKVASAYYTTLYQLRKLWATLEECLVFWVHVDQPSVFASGRHPGTLHMEIIHFVLHSPSLFWDMLQKKSPRALIIYSYFTLVWEGLDLALSKLEGRDDRGGKWWTEGRAAMDIQGILDDLDLMAKSAEDLRNWRDWVTAASNVLGLMKREWWLVDDMYASPGSASTSDIQAATPGYLLV